MGGVIVEIVDDYHEVFILKGRYLQGAGLRIDIPKETVDRWERVCKEYQGVQKEMRGILERCGNDDE